MALRPKTPCSQSIPLVLPHFTAPTSRHIPPISKPIPWAAGPRAGSNIQVTNLLSLQEAMPGMLEGDTSLSQGPGGAHPIPQIPDSLSPGHPTTSPSLAEGRAQSCGSSCPVPGHSAAAAAGHGLVSLLSLSPWLPGSQACGLQSLLGALARCQGSFSYLHRNGNLSEIKVLGWL